MTFEDFQATRRHVADIAAATGLDLGQDVQPGHVYDSDLHIFDMPDGRHLLVIFNDQTISADLEALERKLYAFASDEAMFQP